LQDRQKIRDSWVALPDNRNFRDDGAKRIPYCWKAESMELQDRLQVSDQSTVFEARFGPRTAVSDWSGIPAGPS
jgi:hypothetical protein